MERKEQLTEERRQALVEAGLSRIATHLKSGRGLGILSAKTPEIGDAEAHDATQSMVRDFRNLGYGAIARALGRSDWGQEAAIIVPGVSRKHLKDIAQSFDG